MKERPILFSGPMVRAILEGRKTQTRRIIKKILPMGASDPDGYWGPLDCECILDHDSLPSSLAGIRQDCVRYINGKLVGTSLCPLGVPGDRLWVRETFQNISYKEAPEESCVLYRADGEQHPPDVSWRLSIFMPRWASRITLEITDVRVQRSQDISAKDCEAEGIRVWEGERMCHAGESKMDDAIYRDAFAKLWNSINAKRGFGWNANPWVWALTFRRVAP